VLVCVYFEATMIQVETCCLTALQSDHRLCCQAPLMQAFDFNLYMCADLRASTVPVVLQVFLFKPKLPQALLCTSCSSKFEWWAYISTVRHATL